MGIALKILQANFSSVAVDRVTFTDPVPCTGISLNVNTKTFTRVGEEYQLIATKTPIDTTDAVVWTSSNSNIATVDSTGIVTIHGIGTATITATCGNYSATCTINQTSLKAQYDLQILSSHYPYDANADTSGDKYITIGDSQNETGVGQAKHNNADLAIGGSYDIECVRVPYGATKVYVKTSDDVDFTFAYMYVIDTNATVTKGTKTFPAYLRYNTLVSSNTGKAVNYGEAIVFRPGNGKSTSTLSYIYFT